MSFLIRRISTATDGREIIRDQRVSANTLTIGRGADNDISLSDLSLEPHHATIALGSDGRVQVTAPGKGGVRINGRRRKGASIDPAALTRLDVGGHCITLQHDDSGQVVLTVRRTASISRSAEDVDEARMFSLRGLMIGKRGMAWLLGISVLIGFLAIPVYGYLQRQMPDHRNIHSVRADASWSSGPLSTAHRHLEGKCEACHVKAFVSVRNATCQSCHTNVHDHAPMARMAKTRRVPDFGGRILAAVGDAFGTEGPGSCTSCHTEHEGAGPMPPTAQAFCSDCHSSLKARLPDTRLGDAGDFGTLHPQFRPLVATAPGATPVMVRASLDRRPRDESGLKFPHKLHLDSRGGVAQMARTLKDKKGYGDALVCSDCHTPTADRTRFLPVAMEKDCQSCHSLAFDRVRGTVRTLRHGDTAQMIADLRSSYRGHQPPPASYGGMARRRPGAYAEGRIYHAGFGRSPRVDSVVRRVFSPGGACYDCHIVKSPATSGTGDWDVTPVHQPMRYLMGGWFDHNAHSTQTCSTCHAAATSTRASDLLLPDLKSCRTCHGGEASSAAVPSGCAMCHSYHAKDDAPWKSRGGQAAGMKSVANRSRGFAAND